MFRCVTRYYNWNTSDLPIPALDGDLQAQRITFAPGSVCLHRCPHRVQWSQTEPEAVPSSSTSELRAQRGQTGDTATSIPRTPSNSRAISLVARCFD